MTYPTSKHDTLERRILTYIEQHPGATRHEIGNEFSRCVSIAKKLERMEAKGLISSSADDGKKVQYRHMRYWVRA